MQLVSVVCHSEAVIQRDVNQLLRLLQERMRAYKYKPRFVASTVMYRGSPSDSQVFASKVDTKNGGICDLLKNVKVVELISGDAHSIARTDTGKILVSGGVVQANTFTQYYLTELSSLASKNIVKMASRGGAFHALFLTDDGKVYAFGYNSCGSLGVGDTDSRTDVVQVQLDLFVYDIFVGGDGAGHSAAITGKNTAYVWGKNSTDSLGIESGESVVLPTLVPDLQVTKISFGDTHSLFITPDGKLYSCGKPDNESFCVHSLTSKTPKLFFDKEAVIDAEMGLGFGLAMTVSKKFFMWGEIEECVRYEEPTQILELSCLNIRKFSLGWEQCVLLDEDGNAYEFVDSSPHEPRKIRCPSRVLDVVCGSYISFILLE